MADGGQFSDASEDENELLLRANKNNKNNNTKAGAASLSTTPGSATGSVRNTPIIQSGRGHPRAPLQPPKATTAPQTAGEAAAAFAISRPSNAAADAAAAAYAASSRTGRLALLGEQRAAIARTGPALPVGGAASTTTPVPSPQIHGRPSGPENNTVRREVDRQQQHPSAAVGASNNVARTHPQGEVEFTRAFKEANAKAVLAAAEASESRRLLERMARATLHQQQQQQQQWQLTSNNHRPDTARTPGQASHTMVSGPSTTLMPLSGPNANAALLAQSHERAKQALQAATSQELARQWNLHIQQQQQQHMQQRSQNNNNTNVPGSGSMLNLVDERKQQQRALELLKFSRKRKELAETNPYLQASQAVPGPGQHRTRPIPPVEAEVAGGQTAGRPANKQDMPLQDSGRSPLKRAKSRRTKVKNVLKTFVIAQPQEEGPVACATRFVADELQHGMWPSPFQVHGADAATTTSQNMQIIERQHKSHMKVVAASLEHFSRHVILPSFENSSHGSRMNPPPPSEATNSKPGESKSFFGALLALREVMTQNAEAIFGNEVFSSAIEEDDEHKRSSSKKKMDRNPGYARRHKERLKEDQLYCATLLATGVILAAIKRYIPANSQPVVQEFLDVARSYEDGEEQFASCLQEDDGRACGVLPNGKRLDKEENVALNVSFNRARKAHPLVRRSEERRLKIKVASDLISIPQTNVCVVAMVENLRDWAQRPSGAKRKA